jgi:hypothetical protein
MVEGGVYTAAAMTEFRKAMPCVPSEELRDGLPVTGLVEAFRVKTFMNMVSEIVNRSSADDRRHPTDS